jgi:hypothetical protein
MQHHQKSAVWKANLAKFAYDGVDLSRKVSTKTVKITKTHKVVTQCSFVLDVRCHMLYVGGVLRERARAGNRLP